jgi:hypothetical protein
MINLTLQRGYRRIDIVLREELSTIQSANVHTGLHKLRSDIVSRVLWDAIQE